MQFELAQYNLAKMKFPLESAQMSDFVANLERINSLADAAPGFVWRWQDDTDDATAMCPSEDKVLVNISVWKDISSLQNFVYRSAHIEIMRQRARWFEVMSRAHLVLWWVEQARRPTREEAQKKLLQLQEQGASAEAFTFQSTFPPPY